GVVRCLVVCEPVFVWAGWIASLVGVSRGGGGHEYVGGCWWWGVPAYGGGVCVEVGGYVVGAPCCGLCPVEDMGGVCHVPTPFLCALPGREPGAVLVSALLAVMHPRPGGWTSSSPFLRAAG